MKRIENIFKIITICGIFLFLCIDLTGQGWRKSYVQPVPSSGGELLETQDQGFLIGGNIGFSVSNNSMSMLLVKTDVNGEELWTKSYPYAPIVIKNNSVLELADGSFMIATTDQDRLDVVLLKINNSGDVLWSEKYDNNGWVEEGASLVQTNDGGFVISATTQDSFQCYCGQILLIKTDEFGNMLWENQLPKDFRSLPIDLQLLPNDELLIAGLYATSLNEDSRYLVKTDNLGEIIWEKTYPGSPDLAITSLIKTDDGNFVFCSTGTTFSNFPEMNLAKVDQSGNLLWEKSYDTPSEGTVFDVIETPDQGFLMIGSFGLTFPYEDVFLLKTDENGEELWTKTFDWQGGADSGLSVVNTFDHKYAFTGSAEFEGIGSNQRNAYLVKTDSLGQVYSNSIEGMVYNDADENCQLDSLEKGIPRWIVKAEKDQETFFSVSDSNGVYTMEVDTGTYQISIAPYAYWEPCQDTYSMQFSDLYDTLNLDLPLQASINCPFLEVHVAAPFLRLCAANHYTIQYCNYGTEEALGATVEINLDPNLTYLNATAPLLSQIGTTYTFDVGNLDVGDCGSFSVTVDVPCDFSILGEVLCVEAHIFPDAICDSTLWDGPIIEVTGACNSSGDSVVFIIKNVGMDMQAAYEYIVIEDNIILFQDTYQLAFGEEEIVVIPAMPDATYHLLTGQGSGFPILLGNPIASATVEACIGVPTPEWYNQIPENDGEPYLSIFCTPVVASFDPNDKRAFPSGWTAEHYIDATTDIEYHIRFQNTGTDTAFRVMILDTLSSFLNPASIHIGASSHPYEYQLLNNGVLQFTFPNIMLPDSNVNEAASHGFVSFKIGQYPNNDIGTLITNSAAIYFDFNAPVITNETFHTIGDPWVQLFPVATREITHPGPVKVYPNPMQITAIIEVPEYVGGSKGYFILYNLQGQVVQEKYFEENQFSLEGEQLLAGIYSYEIRLNGKPYSAGKVVIVK